MKLSNLRKDVCFERRIHLPSLSGRVWAGCTAIGNAEGSKAPKEVFALPVGQNCGRRPSGGTHLCPINWYETQAPQNYDQSYWVLVKRPLHLSLPKPLIAA